MKSKFFPLFFAWFTVAVFFMILSSCAKEKQPSEATPAIEEKKPATEESEEVIFTRIDPGPWSGKEDGHVPQIIFEKTETGLKVTVTVNHEMNAEKPHYIIWIKLEDKEGNLLGEKTFQATDETAKTFYELTIVPNKLKAYAKCNLHGIWLGEVDVTME